MLSTGADRRGPPVCRAKTQKGQYRHHGQAERQPLIINPNIKYSNRRFLAAHELFLSDLPVSYPNRRNTAITCSTPSQLEPPVSHDEPTHRKPHNLLQLFSAARPGQCDVERLAIQQRGFANGDHPALAGVAEEEMY